MKQNFYFSGRMLILLTGILLTLFRVYAQETTGSLRGRITDAGGQPLPGVTVQAVHTPSGTRYGTATTPDGRYNLSGLRVGGPYRLEASFIGMETQREDNIQVMLGQVQQVNIALKTGARKLNELQVTATKTGPRTNGAGRNINREELRNMPTISRSIQDVTRLVPQGSKDNTFMGSNFRYNNVTIDGAVNNDAIGFSPSLGGATGTSGMPGSSTRTNPVSMDAIQDMQVYLAPYDVKIGNFTGGSINAVTRSGTNQLEGSVYVYGRNATLTGADRAGDGRKMPAAFYDYQAGLRLGFPIIKNKLFFFTNTEVTGRQDPVQQEAGSKTSSGVLSETDAQQIQEALRARYGIDPGTYGQYNATGRSLKFFNRVDWNINDNNHLAVRNNTIFSDAVQLERDQQNFRFAGIAFKQTNNQQSTVAELNTRINSRLSNNVIAGFSTIHDYRDPTSNPAFPQVQIVGRTPGSTIFLGTDREASIFNMKQRTLELTDNFRWDLGKHHLLFGTHNELYKITYGFVNAWNGRVDYPSVNDFLNNNPSRVRGSYNYFNNDRGYILQHPGAVFNINFYSLYAQDEIQINDRFRITPGIRFDMAHIPNKPDLSEKVSSAVSDKYKGTTFDYRPLNQLDNGYLGKVQVSPRLGFSYDLLEDKSLVLRGGAGLFTGRIPFAWIGYAYYNTGDTYGAYDQRTDNGSGVFIPGTDPLRPGNNGIADFARQNGQPVSNPNAGKTQVDLIDNNFMMPQVFRGSVGVDYTSRSGFRYSIEGIYTQVIKDVMFQQVNLKDNPAYNTYDTAADRRLQPVFPSGGINPAFANAYLLSNTTMGYRYSLTGQVSRKFPGGLNASVAYTYGMSKDVSNGVRNSMESNWQLNQALNPNAPKLAFSNFDIRHRIVATVSYSVTWQQHLRSTFSLFGSFQSGSPYTYGFVNYTAQNTPQQVSLAYIPYAAEAVNFFAPYTEAGRKTVTAAEQANAFNAFIDKDSYLSHRRGSFTERNGGRTPWNNNVDFRFMQDFMIARKGGKHAHMITFTWDILNLTNLLNSQWGWVYFSPNTYNSTASVGLVPFIPGRASQGYPLYNFQDPGKPYSVDFLQSRWQMQMGLRYSF
ncbi:TonB-dependent receptor [Chitinophaga sp. 212800010-3]|uniref:TonB-dependent receptor n=1 Tax=unclassified Chitinophaga TaxID=2619133 RepID=UPI002DEF9149|nr:Carboxypeptidase regulatory-like domain-containing protein [Chitinophaga sp. 212800010-3]